MWSKYNQFVGDKEDGQIVSKLFLKLKCKKNIKRRIKEEGWKT